MRSHALVLTVAAMMMAGCSAATLQPRQQPVPKKLDVDKWFAVIVDKAGNGCAITVQPADANEGNVAVKPGWKVGWVLINRCNTVQAMELEFEFKSTRQPKRPLTFDAFKDSALVGKVKKSVFGGCHEDAPCGEYKYKVTVGRDTLDPDIEIVH
jgi:hypothetical protein